VSRFVALTLLALLASCQKKRAPTPGEAPPLPTASQAVVVDAGVWDARAKDKPTDFVNLKTVAPGVQLDMRYASSNNFVGKAIYPSATCLLRRPVAAALAQAQQQLEKKGLRLLIWDCYRPFSVQELFWELVPDKRYVAEPLREGQALTKGSKHNRGAAVDLSLATKAGEPLKMPTDHDDFSERAHRGFQGASKQAATNAALLDQAMAEVGFVGIKSEWWHFDYQGWDQFELSDYPLTKIKPKSSRSDM